VKDVALAARYCAVKDLFERNAVFVRFDKAMDGRSH
jgi:hypothetical protein